MGLLGKFLSFLLELGDRCKPTGGDSESLGAHGVSAATVGVSGLAHDHFNFEITSQVPEGLSQHVVSSKKAQANWYRKLVETWREAKPPPRTDEEAGTLVIQTLKGHKKADVQGLLALYGLPHPNTLVQVSAGVPTSLPQGVKFEFQTLPEDIYILDQRMSLFTFIIAISAASRLKPPAQVVIDQTESQN